MAKAWSSLIVSSILIFLSNLEALKLKKCCPSHQQLHLDLSDHMECINLKENEQQNERTNIDNEEAAYVSNETTNIWWLPENLNYIETLSDEINILDEVELTLQDFSFESIPCFNRDPEVLLIQSHMFLDVNSSELVLSKLEAVPKYAADIPDRDERRTKRSVKQQDHFGHVSQLVDSVREEVYNTNERLSISKRQSETEVEIVRERTNGAGKIRHDEINSRFPFDVFCVDRIGFKRNDINDDNSTVLPDSHEDISTPETLDESEPNDWTHVVLLCPCETTNAVCVRKCCSGNKILHVTASEDKNAHCVNHEPQTEDFDVDIYTSTSIDEPPLSFYTVPHYLLHGTPQCRHGSYLLRNTTVHSALTMTDHMRANSSSKSSFKILSNSSVFLTASRALVANTEYCIDSIHYGASRLRMTGNILLCRQQEPRVDQTRRLIYSICFIVGTGFLIITLVVYAMLPELRKSVHSWNIMAHIACSIVAYTAIVIANLYTMSPFLCILTAYILQISFLSSQLWLNAMCIDIACTFSGLRAPGGRRFSAVDRRKFFYYSAYTWGTTAAISGLTCLADTSGLLTWDSPLKPNFGVKTCWFKESTSIAVFFYGPIGVLLLVNLVLFNYTCWKIRAAQKDTAITSAHRHVGGRTEDQTQYTTFIKLFLLMGITWAFEIVSWVLGGPHYLWYLTDLLNVLRGVFIFIILCCKRNVLTLVRKRIQHGHLRRGAPGPRPRTESNTSRRTLSTDHIILNRLHLSSTQSLSTIHQGDEPGLEPKSPGLSVVQEVEGK